MNHITNEAVRRVLEGSRYWEDLYEAVSVTESFHHPDPEVDQEIEKLWVAAEYALGDDKDTIVENLTKIYNLLETA
jgi:hypothetical protein